ncbi:MAG: M3 family oligoendopeptidase [Thaumarchaeota archaeon]|nr:M3 family oligoendopeptidase [Nitrososphaerota archaeon]
MAPAICGNATHKDVSQKGIRSLLFDYSSLPREFPRSFLPNDLSFDWDRLAQIFDELQTREIRSVEEMERWLSSEWEFTAAISEERAIRSIRYTTQTDNPEYEKAHLNFITELEPKIKHRGFELDKKYVSSPFRSGLPHEVYSTFDKKRENRVSLFRPKNVELEKADSELVQKYEKIMGAMTVQYKGEERTLQQMGRFLEETDRGVRQEAWELAEQRRAKEADKLNHIFDEMIRTRAEIAKNAGFENFRDYSFRKHERFDYTPEDCFRFHDAVETYFVPLSREMDEDRKRRMGIEDLRPWDLFVDPDGRSPLRPFNGAGELVTGCSKVLVDVDRRLAEYFTAMSELRLLDLESRKGKAPGGYMEDLSSLRLPFIFMNAVGRDTDVRVLLHESGHSFHTFLSRDSGFPTYRGQDVPTEFAEVASTTMELVSGEHIEGTIYDKEGARRSNRDELLSMVKLFCWVTTIDAFQHWVYTHPEHTREEREKEWLNIFRRYSGLESWEGYEAAQRNRWQRQIHLFEAPFYYIEYGIATLGALGIWVRYRSDPHEAISAYKSALSLGASRSLPELFGAAGLPWDFGRSQVGKCAGELRKALLG